VKRERQTGTPFLVSGVTILLFVVPLVVLVLYAVADRWQYPDIIPTEFGMRGVEFLIRNGRGIGRAIVSSTAYSVTVVVVSFAICVFPASVLARTDFRGRLAVEAVLLSPILVPAITYGMGIHFLFIAFGLANRTVGVVLVLTAASYPYMLRALIAGFQQIDPDYDTCAANLGASVVRRLVFVTIPLLGPAILAGSTVVFLVAFSDYFLVFLIGGGAVPSFTGYLFPFLSSGDRTLGSALTLLFVSIPLVLFVLMESTLKRYYRRRRMLR
jgi:ABC-type spermidine/putrescine transport system permease subunit II